MSMTVGRISTLQFNQMNRDLISRTTVSLQQAAKEVVTGRRADVYIDLGPQAAGTLTLRTREEETQAYMKSNSLLQGRLQVQLDSVDAIRGQVTDVLEPVLANASLPLAGADTIQLQARTALEITISQLNVSFGGEALFGGTESGATPLIPYAEVNPDTGLSPEDVVNSIITGPPATLADITQIMADLDAVFSSASANPNEDFESTFYRGTPELDGSGVPNSRISARIEPGLELDYGLQANDEPFREVIKGLAMLAAFDVTEIADRDVYVAWMEEVTKVLGDASLEVLNISAEIGFRQQTVETAQRRLEAVSNVNVTQLAALEEVDPYEAATRMTALETQLRATYEVTAQLNSLSLLNYL